LAKCEVLATVTNADFTALLVKLWKTSSLLQVNGPLVPGGCKGTAKSRADGKLSRALLLDV